jgi:hypothetical protein
MQDSLGSEQFSSSKNFCFAQTKDLQPLLERIEKSDGPEDISSEICSPKNYISLCRSLCVQDSTFLIELITLVQEISQFCEHKNTIRRQQQRALSYVLGRELFEKALRKCGIYAQPIFEQFWVDKLKVTIVERAEAVFVEVADSSLHINVEQLEMITSFGLSSDCNISAAAKATFLRIQTANQIMTFNCEERSHCFTEAKIKALSYVHNLFGSLPPSLKKLIEDESLGTERKSNFAPNKIIGNFFISHNFKTPICDLPNLSALFSTSSPNRFFLLNDPPSLTEGPRNNYSAHKTVAFLRFIALQDAHNRISLVTLLNESQSIQEESLNLSSSKVKALAYVTARNRAGKLFSELGFHIPTLGKSFYVEDHTITIMEEGAVFIDFGKDTPENSVNFILSNSCISGVTREFAKTCIEANAVFVLSPFETNKMVDVEGDLYKKIAHDWDEKYMHNALLFMKGEQIHDEEFYRIASNHIYECYAQPNSESVELRYYSYIMSNAAYDIIKKLVRDPLLSMPRGLYANSCILYFPRSWAEKSEEYKGNPDDSTRLLFYTKRETIDLSVKELLEDGKAYKNSRLITNSFYEFFNQDLRWRVWNILNAFFRPEKELIEFAKGKQWTSSSNDQPSLLDGLVMETWRELLDQRYAACSIKPFSDIHEQRVLEGKRSSPSEINESLSDAPDSAEYFEISQEIESFFQDKPFWPLVPQLQPKHPEKFYKFLYSYPENVGENKTFSKPHSQDPRLSWFFKRTADLALEVMTKELREPIQQESSQRDPAFFYGEKVYKQDSICAAPHAGLSFNIQDQPISICVSISTLNAIVDKQMLSLKNLERPGICTHSEICKIVSLLFLTFFHQEFVALKWLANSRDFSSTPGKSLTDCLALQVFDLLMKEVSPRITRALVYERLYTDVHKNPHVYIPILRNAQTFLRENRLSKDIIDEGAW